MPFDRMSIDDVDFPCKRVLIRADFDVPMNNGEIVCTKKITAAVQTIKCILEKGPKYIALISHLGSPNGQQDCSLSLRPIASILQEALGKEVKFLPDCVGQEVEAELCQARKGQVYLLENLRFHIEEEGKGCDKCGHSIVAKKEDVECFKTSLKKLADIYVNDALNASCCPNASILGACFQIRAAGCLLKREVELFSKILECPEKPFVIIIGGAKLAEKVGFIMKMIEIADEIIVAGGPALTFLKEVCAVNIGCSPFDEEGAKSVQCLVEKATGQNVSMNLPDDFIVANKISNDADTCEVAVEDGVPDGFYGLDVGVKTRKKFKSSLENAKTILWTGPPGVFEIEKFSCGSRCMMKAIAEATKKGAFTAIAGRATPAIPSIMKMEDDVVSFISLAGEAGIAYLEGAPMPGLEVLCPKPKNGC